MWITTEHSKSNLSPPVTLLLKPKVAKMLAFITLITPKDFYSLPVLTEKKIIPQYYNVIYQY